MRKIRDFLNGMDSHNVDSRSGIVVSYRSGHMPHGRILTGLLISMTGEFGILRVSSKSKYDKPFDVDSEIKLDKEGIDEWAGKLIFPYTVNHNTRICDGWRVVIKWFRNNQYYENRYVVGLRTECPELVGRLDSIDSELLKCGSA